MTLTFSNGETVRLTSVGASWRKWSVVSQEKVTAEVFRLDHDPGKLLQGNTLCADANKNPARFIVFYEEPNLGVAVFQSKNSPWDINSAGLCGTFSFDASEHKAPTVALPTVTLPTATTSSSGGESVVLLKRDGGDFVVPVTINDTITLDFIVDSGASDVSIPADVILTLNRAGTIQSSDFVGTKTYRLADGSTVPSTTLIIHKLKVGDREVQNVMASVSDVKASLLLGQSFFRAFDSWSIDNRRGALILKSGAPSANEIAAATAPPNPQSVVRAFYAALAAGAGDQAAALLIASKRDTGPLSAAAISGFYGRLEQPLELLAIESTGPETYLVRYRYKAPRSAVCNGRAIVTTTTDADSTLISRINALDGC
jgi:clan AA aspartic protease (TIGR02281 family)